MLFRSRDRLAVQGFNRFTNSENRIAKDEVKSLRASIRAIPFPDLLTLDFNYETTSRETTNWQQVESRNYVDGVALTGGVPDISSRDRYGIQVRPIQHEGDFKIYNWQAMLQLAGQRLTYVGGRLDGKNFTDGPEDPGGFLANPSGPPLDMDAANRDRKSTRLNSSH